MNPYQLSILASIYAAVAEMEAMKAFNMHALAVGKTTLYGEDAFASVQSRLEQLAVEARNS